MTRILEIPELLRAVLGEVHDDWIHERRKTIVPCMLVNHIWESELRSLLWWICGSNFSKDKIPTVKCLLAVHETRRQLYANCVQILKLYPDYRGLDGEWEWHLYDTLSKLSFPKLEEFSVISYREGDELSREQITSFSSYIRPGLKSFKVKNSSNVRHAIIVDTELLLALQQSSRSLQEITLHFPYQCLTWPPSSVFAHFFTQMRALTYIDLNAERSPLSCVSSDAFANISGLPFLRMLCFPHIQKDWTTMLEPGAFPSLTSLVCEIDSAALEQLLRLVPQMRVLSIGAAPGSIDMLNVIAQAKLEDLMHLQYNPCAGTNLSCQALLAIADHSKVLEHLQIPEHYNEDIELEATADDLDDDGLLEVAKRLPDLNYLQLYFNNSRLTEMALVHLGTCCRALKYCEISADVDYGEFVRTAMPGFENLWSLAVLEPDDVETPEIEPDAARMIALDLLRIMPGLKYADLPAQENLERSIRALARCE